MNTMNRPTTTTSRRRPSQAQSAGFTLVEVLVTLALTMIMMLLFARIFQIAGNFVTRQKGIGENDQSARILTTVLQTDLQARTMQNVAPFHPYMQLMSDDTKRQGYFYYSENNPLDETDDVVQFTINLKLLPSSNPTTNGQLSGLATNLPLPWQSGVTYAANSYVRPAGTTPSSQSTGFIYKTTGGLTSGATEPSWSSGTPTLAATISDGGGTWTTVASAVDQPDGDDGVMSYLSTPQVAAASAGTETINPPNTTPNNTGESQYAEVTYFLRHGNLYRRVLLIRNPYDYGINTPGTSTSQPLAQDAANVNLILGAYPPTGYLNTFWGDFDYAARINLGSSPGVQFLAQSAPESSLVNTDLTGTAGLRVGRPDNRFGFDQVYNTTGAGPLINGAPREFALPYNSSNNTIASTTPVFFGRYTDEETSNLNFLFPGALPSVGGTPTSPMAAGAVLGLDTTSYTMWLLNANPPTANLSFAKGPRRGEDILLTNVVSFDVKLWDNNYSELAAGIDVNRNGVIDTTAAFADMGHTASGDFAQAKNAFPIYGPTTYTTAYTVPAAGSNSWSPTYTYTNASNGLTYNYNNVFDTWYRTFNFDNLSRTYDGDASDTNFYAPAPYRPRLGKQWTAGTHYNYLDMVDPVNTANGYVYQCTTVGGGTSAATPPAGQVDPFHLDDVVGTPNAALDNTLQWTPVAPVNVQAIQITVKYLDPTQNLLRQVTIVQSLVPPFVP
jgi:competence protein ComGC